MRSMTGYGQATGESARYRVRVSVRAVNHRFLDVALRLKDEYMASERAVREALAAELERGRVEVGVEIERLAEGEATVRVRRTLLDGLNAELRQLEAAGLVGGRLEVRDLLQVPGLIEVTAAGTGWEAEDEELMVGVVRVALAELVAARETEGAQLARVLAERVEALRPIVVSLRGRREQIKAAQLGALRERLTALLGDQPIEPQRLAQEAAILVERADVAEELDRLAAHLDHFARLVGEAGAVGRRLDFVVQEMTRELNTLGAKCRDVEMSQQVVEAKLLSEQLREQVQNVE